LMLRAGMNDQSAWMYRRSLTAVDDGCSLDAALGLVASRRPNLLAFAHPALEQALLRLTSDPALALERSALHLSMAAAQACKMELALAADDLAKQQLGPTSHMWACCMSLPSSKSLRSLSNVRHLSAGSEFVLPALRLSVPASSSGAKAPALAELRDAVAKFARDRKLESEPTWLLERVVDGKAECQEFQCKSWAAAGVVREAIASRSRSGKDCSGEWFLRPAVRPWLNAQQCSANVRAYVLFGKERGASNLMAWLYHEAVVLAARAPHAPSQQVEALIVAPEDAEVGLLSDHGEVEVWRPQLLSTCRDLRRHFSERLEGAHEDEAYWTLVELTFVAECGGRLWLVQMQDGPALWARDSKATPGGRSMWGPRGLPLEAACLLEENLTKPLIMSLLRVIARSSFREKFLNDAGDDHWISAS